MKPSLEELVKFIVEDVEFTDERYRSNYRDGDWFGHPIPFFGDLTNAEVVTISINPSSTEFDPKREWPKNISPEKLCNRLVTYFSSASPKPHHWFDKPSKLLKASGASYLRNAAHLDVSPRATRSMNNVADPSLFIEMLRHDAHYLPLLFQFCPNVKCVLISGEITGFGRGKNMGVCEFIEQELPALWRNVGCNKKCYSNWP